jgi:hypothetical protein
MSGIPGQNDPPQRPPVAAPGHKREGPRAQRPDAVFWELDRLGQAVAAARVRDVRADDLGRLGRRGHPIPVLALAHHELEPPQPVRGQAEPAAHGRPLRVAQEAKLPGEEVVVHVFGRVPEPPQRKVRVRLFGGERDVPVQGDPGFLVAGSAHGQAVTLDGKKDCSTYSADFSMTTPLGSRYFLRT